MKKKGKYIKRRKKKRKRNEKKVYRCEKLQ